MSAAGFLKSTTRDMLRYMEIFRTDGTCDGVRILSPESVDQICTPYAQPVPGQFYGYGMMVHSNYKGVSLVEHGGNIKGVSAWVSCIREKGITGVTLTNLVSSPGAEIMLGAINTALNVPVKTRRYNFKPFYCPPEKLAQYEGVYISGEGATVKVTAKGNNLQFEMGGARFTGRPIGVDTFSMRRKGLDSAVRFLRNTKGDTWGIAAGFRIIPKAPPAPTEMSAT